MPLPAEDNPKTVFNRLFGEEPGGIEARRRRRSKASPPKVETRSTAKGSVLQLHGAWTDTQLGELRAALTQCATNEQCVRIDLAGVTAVGGTFVALLLLARGWFETRGGLDIVGPDASVSATLRRHLAAEALLGTD